MVGHGTIPRGEKNPKSILTEAQAMEVFRRAHAGEKHRTIAQDYGISTKYIGKIKSGIKWGWLTGASA
jgi:uncharacterized protein YerC